MKCPPMTSRPVQRNRDCKGRAHHNFWGFSYNTAGSCALPSVLNAINAAHRWRRSWARASRRRSCACPTRRASPGRRPSSAWTACSLGCAHSWSYPPVLCHVLASQHPSSSSQHCRCFWHVPTHQPKRSPSAGSLTNAWSPTVASEGRHAKVVYTLVRSLLPTYSAALLNARCQSACSALLFPHFCR